MMINACNYTILYHIYMYNKQIYVYNILRSKVCYYYYDDDDYDYKYK